MAQLQPSMIIAICSGVIGLLLLIASSCFLDLYREVYEPCKKFDDFGKAAVCDKILVIMAGGSFGVIAAFMQILAAAICFRNFGCCWAYTTVMVFIFSILAFSLPLAEDVDTTAKREGLRGSMGVAGATSTATKVEFFLVMACLDFLFTCGFMVYVCIFGGGVQQAQQFGWNRNPQPGPIPA